MKLTSIERETIVNFNEAEDTAEIYTHNAKLINRIRNLCRLHPNLFIIKNEDEYGAVTCVLPKRRLSVVLTAPISTKHSMAISESIIKNRPWEKSPIIPNKKSSVIEV